MHDHRSQRLGRPLGRSGLGESALCLAELPDGVDEQEHPGEQDRPGQAAAASAGKQGAGDVA